MRPLLALLFISIPGACEVASPVSLFNGRDLAGWVHEGPRATFSAANGEVRTSGAGNQPNWIRTDREYENFRLTFEYKLAQWAEAAVILRGPRQGRPMMAGIAIVLAHDFHNEVTPHVTGAIHAARPPLNPLPESWGKWQRVEIDLNADRLRASIDGVSVQDVDLASDPRLGAKLRRGFIGFPDLGYAYSVRNVRLEEHPATLRYRDLFDGRTISGWELRGKGEWDVRHGILTGGYGHGTLYAPGEFADAELTMMVRAHDRANGGVFLRGSPDPKLQRGFEVQIYSPPDAVYPTGSVYGKARARISGDYEGRWFLMQIVLKGSSCSVRLDGEEVARFDGLEGPASGRIGLQIHSDNAWIEFRDIRVSEPR